LRENAYDLGAIRYDPRSRGRDTGPDKKRMDKAEAAVLAAFDRALADQDGLRERVAEVVRRAGLPVTPSVTGLPATEKECAAAMAKCVRLVVDHVMEPLRALSTPAAPKKDRG
jgi:hypothetical protein